MLLLAVDGMGDPSFLHNVRGTHERGNKCFVNVVFAFFPASSSERTSRHTQAYRENKLRSCIFRNSAKSMLPHCMSLAAKKAALLLLDAVVELDGDGVVLLGAAAQAARVLRGAAVRRLP